MNREYFGDHAFPGRVVRQIRQGESRITDFLHRNFTSRQLGGNALQLWISHKRTDSVTGNPVPTPARWGSD